VQRDIRDVKSPGLSHGDPVALIFPGQGSQSPGMGRLLYSHSAEARLAFEEASDITHIDIARICFEGSADELAETRVTQPAVLTTSVAFLRAMREKLSDVGRAVRPRMLGGHSLGLFSAAVAAEAISFRDSLLVILERARLMGSFNEARPVGMASIIGLDHATVAEICRGATLSPDDRVDVANHNLDTQIVISGDLSALTRAMEQARALQARAIQLKVRVSSHTPLHTEQAAEFAEVIRDVSILNPSSPIVSNISSQLLDTAERLRAEFEMQLRSPVYWAENVRAMSRQGVTTFIEVGPGHVLANMVRRVADRATAVSLDDAREDPVPISILPDPVAR
jgi:[acyl-carrier-protein] S-malonyltransferase